MSRKYLRYTPELADQLCELMVELGSLPKACRMPGMPSRSTVYNWLQASEAFRQKFELARYLLAEMWADEIVAISDDSSADVTIDEHGREIVDHERINRDRLRVDTRKWLMSKWNPQRYGDRVTTDITVRRDVRELTDAELLRIVHQQPAVMAKPEPSGEDGGSVH